MLRECHILDVQTYAPAGLLPVHVAFATLPFPFEVCRGSAISIRVFSFPAGLALALFSAGVILLRPLSFGICKLGICDVKFMGDGKINMNGSYMQACLKQLLTDS